MATYNIEITRHSDILAKLHALAAGENEYFKMRVKTNYKINKSCRQF